MAIKYIPPGQGFEFSRDFGFTGSAEGRHDAKDHPFPDADEYGDGSYVERAKGGRVGLADGGQPMMQAPTSIMNPQMQQATAPAQTPAVPMQPGMKTGGRVRRAMGGPALQAPGQGPGQGPGQVPGQSPMAHATVSMPAADMAKAAQNIAQASKVAGARSAVGALAQAARNRRAVPGGPLGGPPAAMMSPVAQAPAAPIQGGIAGLKKGGRAAVHRKYPDMGKE